MKQRKKENEFERFDEAQELEQWMEEYAHTNCIPVKDLKEHYDRYMLSEAVMQLTAMSKD